MFFPSLIQPLYARERCQLTFSPSFTFFSFGEERGEENMCLTDSMRCAVAWQQSRDGGLCVLWAMVGCHRLNKSKDASPSQPVWSAVSCHFMRNGNWNGFLRPYNSFYTHTLTNSSLSQFSVCLSHRKLNCFLCCEVFPCVPSSILFSELLSECPPKMHTRLHISSSSSSHKRYEKWNLTAFDCVD